MCDKEYKYSILKTVPDDNNDGDNHPTEKNERCLYVTRRWFKTSSRAAAVVCLVGLLLFMGLYIHCVNARNLDGSQIRYNNLVEKNKQLTIRLNNLSEERDQLRTKYHKQSEERDQLQTNYNELSNKRDQLQNVLNHVRKSNMQEREMESESFISKLLSLKNVNSGDYSYTILFVFIVLMICLCGRKC